MSLPRFVHSFPVSCLLLRTAALLVPRQARKEWLAEWHAELWHVWQACHAPSSRALYRRGEVTAFCLGAFLDAFWMRRDSSRTASAGIVPHGSPARCELGLAALAALGLALAFCLPGVRKVIQPSPYWNAGNLVTISRAGYMGARFPTVRLSDYRTWSGKMGPGHAGSGSTRRFFTGVAFFQPIERRVRTEKHRWVELSISRASDNLFELLSIPVQSIEASQLPSGSAPRAVLSRSAWRKYFAGDPKISGRVVTVAGQEAVIAGVVKDEDWRLPGHIDLWLLESDRGLATLPSRSQGFVLARVVPSSFPDADGGRREMTVFRAGGAYDLFDCVSLAERSRQPFSIFLFALMLACLALPATTSLPLGEYPQRRERLPWTTGLRRWAFLATKLAWIVAIVYCGSLDVSYCSASLSLAASQYIELATTFFALLFAFRWALRDQRKRCPVCLRSLTNPAHVGQSSRSFLAWNGTELVCLGGHGLLHVPDLPTSWFSTQRWLYLDPSWSGLFSGGYAVSSGIF